VLFILNAGNALAMGFVDAFRTEEVTKGRSRRGWLSLAEEAQNVTSTSRHAHRLIRRLYSMSTRQFIGGVHGLQTF